MTDRANPIATTLRLFKPLLAVALLIALVAALGGAALRWLLFKEGGARWLLSHVSAVQAEGWHGALLGDRLGAARLRVSWAGGKQSVTLTGFEAEGLVWSWRPSAGAWVGLDAAKLSARSVVVDTGPPSGKPLAAPASLATPLRLRAAAVAVDTLQVGSFELQRITGRVALGDGAEHRADGVRAEWGRLVMEGAARIGTAAPFTVGGEFTARPTGDEFDARLRAAGPLDRIVLDATLAGRAKPPHPAPAADVHAVVAPFAGWPLGELSARTQALDLSALAGALPETRLSGQVQVQVQSSAADAPVSARLVLENALQGRWNEHRLPLQRAQAVLAGRAGERDRLELREFDVQLASAGQPAGHVRGHGEWRANQLVLETTLADLRPQRLDGRAPAMTLAGPFALTLQGLPSPAPGAAAPPPWSATVKAALEGRLDANPRAVQLTLEASGNAEGAELRQLRLQSGAAVAQLSARAARANGGAWQLASAGTLAEFDPVPWWPGEAGSPWRQGPHRLNASWQLDLRLPAGADRLAPLALAPRLAGSGTLRLQDSVLAGVPLALDLKLDNATAEAAPGHLHGELRLAGNRVLVEARGNPAGSGADDLLHLDANAPDLPALGPLLRLRPELAAWAPKSGTASAKLDARGRWPRLATEGSVDLHQLETPDLGLAAAQAKWKLQMDEEGGQPLSMTAEVSGMRLGRQRVERLKAEVQGTPREHQLRLAAALPVKPPAATEQLLGVPLLFGTRGELQGAGQWLPEAGGGGTWRGRVAHLAVGPWDGKSLEGSAAWAEARDLSAEASFDGHGDLVRLQAAPGRVKLADATALRWDEVVVDLHGDKPALALKAEIEAFALAPLLARAQPSVGWKGDLRLAATLDIRAAERFDADVVFERRDGDLTVSDENGTQSLGLTDMRLALAAHDGNWIFTQAFAGRTLGEAAGAVRVRTTADRRWPDAQAPMDGVIDARVANLGVWGSWVPPGWRLSGELRTSATVGGRFGAPEYTGRMSGHDIGVRNLLQGVNVSQGQLDIRLEGAQARIEQFTLKGGDGTLQLSGGAELGESPQARLRIEAERFRLLGRIDRQVVTSGQADLLLGTDRLKLDGAFKVDEALFDLSRRDAPALDDDVTVLRPGDAEKAAETSPVPRTRRDVAVALDVDLGPDLHVRGRGLDARLRGKLRITTPGGKLAINGTVSTAEGGTYAAYGQKLDIERGIVAFSGAADNPRLDILALRPNTDMRVGVQITGNLLTPRARLYSEIDMSDTDKLSWLVLGRAPDGLGRTDALLLQRAAVALLAGEEEAPTDAVIHALGLDEISIGQRDTATASGDTRETVVSFGKQLSRRWYLGYERGVNATTGTWQLIYRIAQRFTLRAQSGSENSLDVLWTWKFDEVPLPPALKKVLPGTAARAASAATGAP